MPSSSQIAANQANAQKSTGPITAEGKYKVAHNAIKHGLFSQNLILADEDPGEYQTLLEQLQSELCPVGILEQSLVERIAIALWRQKRLVRAETAAIELDLKPRKILYELNQELGLNYSGYALSERDLSEFDSEQYHWCQAVLEEYETLDTDHLFDLAQLKKSAPLTYEQLLEDSKEDGQSPKEYLEDFESPSEYFSDLVRYCRNKIKQAEQRPLVLEMAELLKGKYMIPKEKVRDSLSKYQIMQDNQLYKAIKALREAQDWRLKTLTPIPDENGFVLETG